MNSNIFCMKQGMRIITILYDRSGYNYSWLKPLFWAGREFKELGYIIKLCSISEYFPFLYKYSQGMEGEYWNDIVNKEFDIVFLAFHHSISWLGLCDSDTRVNIVRKIKAHSNIVCWLDTADSTGTCLFDIIPYVDVYFKKQILKNKELYTNDLYGGRLFCDFYHNYLGIEDNSLQYRYYPPTSSEYLDKIKISWNLGLSDMFASSCRRYLLLNRLSFPRWCLTDDYYNRKYDIHYRGTGNSSLVGYQRERLSKIIKDQLNLAHPDPCCKVPKSDYIKEVRQSKSILSPFGWGEVCFRDFEAFAYGATLIKPSMEHCATWPDVYIKNETYVPIEWDFSNIDEIFEELNSDKYSIIAKNGQDRYKESLCSKDAKMNFAMHVINGMP